MSTFSELSKRREFLENKRAAFELLKDSVSGIAADQIILDEVLLDLDEKCVAPVIDEINSIENSEFKKAKKAAEKKDVEAKKERKSTKKTPVKGNTKAKKGTTKRKRATTNNTRKRSC